MRRLVLLAISSFCLLTIATVANVGSTPAFAQDCNLAGAPAFGLRTPLVNGAQMGLPFVPARQGAAPAMGDGFCPAPVHPGHQGAPTLIPSNPQGPTDHLGSTTYTLPYNPATESMPGTLGPSLSVPPPPSTPGYDPGMVSAKRDFCRPPVTVTHINPGGGIYASAPTQRWGGQTTRDYGRYKYRGTRSYDWGQQATWGQLSTDGPYQGLPGAMPTWDLYGQRGVTRSGCTTMTIAPY